MNDQDFWETIYCDIFLHFIHSLAFTAPIPTFLHCFLRHKILEAICHIYTTHRPRRNWQGQVHKIVEGQTLETTLPAFNLTAELAFKQVRYY